MTIPIRPGPFAFLAEAGRAGGAAVDAAEKQRKQNLKEDQDRLNMMITLRSQGLIQPDAFGTPEAMSIYKRLGILPVSDKPNSAEQIERTKVQFGAPEQPGFNLPIPSLTGGVPGAGVQVPASGPSAVSDARRATAGLPLRSALGAEGMRAGAVEAGGAAGRAVAGVPTEQVAGAAEAGSVAKDTMQQTKLFGEEAETFVAQALAGADPRKMGVEEAVAKAYALYQADSTNKMVAPLPPNVAERYFADAVQKRIDTLRNQEIAMTRANNPMLLNDPEMRQLNVQIDNANAELARLDAQVNAYVKNMTVAPELARRMIQTAIAANKPVNPAIATELRNYDALEQQRTAKTNELRQLSSKFENTTQTRFGHGPVTADPQIEQRTAWDAAAAYLRQETQGITGAAIVQKLGPRP